MGMGEERYDLNIVVTLLQKIMDWAEDHQPLMIALILTGVLVCIAFLIALLIRIWFYSCLDVLTALNIKKQDTK